MSAKNTIDKMIKGFLKIFSGSSVKKAKFWKYVYNIALHELNIGNGSGVEKSGENNLLKEIQKESPQGDGLIIFDVGGNKGQYTSNLLHFCPKHLYIHLNHQSKHLLSFVRMLRLQMLN